MAIIKCKMCGGDLVIEEGSSVAVCEYCGTKQTVPTADNDKKMTLFTRANRLLRDCEFDKAAGVFESIVAEFPEEAEAYWGLVLCKYGIEYVDDPATGKKVPTCHRSSFDSVMDDKDFENVMNFADLVARKVYRDEAKQIEELRKAIIEVSGKEDPYDVFISYKETDPNGDRTLDSVIAQDIYKELTREGYRVFFSRISLEDKLGTEYEPYIFAALNSAKVMLCVGTDYDNFNAVWVKNEWSRFLSLIAKGEKKVLIPVFKNIDAYDMPKEFAKLSAQDMGKVGAMQDLLRGVDKIIGGKQNESPAAAPAPVVQTIVQSANGVTTDSLLKRGNLFLEDGDWKSADEYFDKVLDIDPENGSAYLGKLLAELKVSDRSKLKNQALPFDESNSYKKALRFADASLKSEMEEALSVIRERNELDRKTNIYNHACNAMKHVTNEDGFESAAELFAQIPGFKDADSLAQQCLEKAENCRKYAIYSSARSKMSRGNVSSYETAISIFQAISGWKDADEQIRICREKIAEIKAKEEADRLEAERKAEERRIAAEKAAKKLKKAFAIGTPIVAACIAFLLVLTTVIIPNSKYNAAVALMNDGKYEEAISAFEALNGYKDSTDKISLCQTALKDIDYNTAVSLLNDGKIIDAYESLVALNGYKDSTTKASEIFGQYKIEKMKIAEVGDVVWFGAYEQDNNTSNGKEDVEWIVLAKENGKALVISKYALDCQKFNSTYTDVTWEKCSLRKWMNGTFLNNAFSSDEQAKISTTTVSADKVFLLSITEAEKYFSTNSARQCSATAYAKAQGANTNTGNGNCWWWLRSPGSRQYGAARVNGDGSVFYRGDFVDSDDVCVRPALWINLDS